VISRSCRRGAGPAGAAAPPRPAAGRLTRPPARRRQAAAGDLVLVEAAAGEDAHVAEAGLVEDAPHVGAEGAALGARAPAEAGEDVRQRGRLDPAAGVADDEDHVRTLVRRVTSTAPPP
jgi:hypothetical protein